MILNKKIEVLQRKNYNMTIYSPTFKKTRGAFLFLSNVLPYFQQRCSKYFTTSL